MLLVFSLRTLANVPSHRKSPKPHPVPLIFRKVSKIMLSLLVMY